MNDRMLVLTIAAILYLVTGLGYSVGTLPVTRYLIRNRSLPIFWGIHFYAGGFFDRRGINWVIGASVTFIVAGVLFLYVAFLLWNSMILGGILALILFPVVTLVSIGSLAPIPWVIEPIKIILVLIGWSTLL
jgi:hypothetical protein